MTDIKSLLPEKLQGKAGPISYSIGDAPLTGLYFSAHWCSPCRCFTPILSEFYKVVNSNNQQIEIIFVSADSDKKSFDEYYNEMPFAALPFELRDEKDKLCDAFGIRGIPNLLVFNKDGKIVDEKARATLQMRFVQGEVDENEAQDVIDEWMKN